MSAQSMKENDDERVEGMFGSIGEQKNEAYYDDRSDAEDDLLKGRIKFPKEKLYGREDELDKLRSIFNGVSQQAGEDAKSAVVFLAGYCGTGKSALVEAFIKQLDEDRSHLFASGKYSELQTGTPFSVIAEALRKVTSELMNGDPNELQRVRDNLKAAGIVGDGDEGEVLIGMFPVLSRLLRSEEQQQEIEPASVTNLHNFDTLKYVVQRFVRALCTKVRPFMLYIDDLQWADVASLEMITALLLDKSLKYFMFIGAYRSNEVNEEHSFYKRIVEVENSRGDAVQRIELFNLSIMDIGAFIADSVDKHVEDVYAIMEVVYKKTMGNIFFVMQALEELVRKNALYYDVMCFEWQWNMSKVELESFLSDDVSQMIQSKMQTLPQTLRRGLVVAAYIRSTFDAETLHALLEGEGCSVKVKELSRLLERAVSEGLLWHVSGSGEYTFAHDRIRAAAYSVVSPGEDRDQLLVQIATFLVDRGTSTREDWMLFFAVHHFNSVPARYTNQNSLARLNLRVAKLSLSKAAFSQAVELLRAGVACLAKDAAWKNYHFCLKLFNHLVEVEYALGNYDLAEAAIDEILENATSLQDKFTAHCTLIKTLGEKGSRNYSLAVERAVEISKAYGQEFPLTPSKFDLLREHVSLRIKLQNRPLVTLATFPVTQDDSLMKILNLLSTRAAFMQNEHLLTMVCLRAMRLSCSKGISKFFPQFALNLGVQLRRNGKLKKACAYANLAMSLMLRFQEEKGAEYTKSLFSIHATLLHLRPSFKDSLEVFLESQRILFSFGSGEVGMASAMLYCFCYLALGFPLSSMLEQTLLLNEDKSQEFNLPGFTMIFQFLRQFLLNLRGKSNNPTLMKGQAFDEEEAIGRLEGNSRTMAVRDVSIFRLQLAYIFDDPFTMEEMLGRLASLPMFDRPIAREHLRLSFVGLAALALGHLRKNKIYLKLGFKITKHFHKLDRVGSVNAHPIYLCLKAASSPNKKTYDEAIMACSKSKLMHLEAMMNERCGIFCKGNEELMEDYLSKSLWLYHDWGAIAKVNQLKERHSFLRASARPRSPRHAVS